MVRDSTPGSSFQNRALRRAGARAWARHRAERRQRGTGGTLGPGHLVEVGGGGGNGESNGNRLLSNTRLSSPVEAGDFDP